MASRKRLTLLIVCLCVIFILFILGQMPFALNRAVDHSVVLSSEGMQVERRNLVNWACTLRGKEPLDVRAFVFQLSDEAFKDWMKTYADAVALHAQAIELDRKAVQNDPTPKLREMAKQCLTMEEEYLMGYAGPDDGQLLNVIGNWFARDTRAVVQIGYEKEHVVVFLMMNSQAKQGTFAHRVFIELSRQIRNSIMQDVQAGNIKPLSWPASKTVAKEMSDCFGEIEFPHPD